MKRIITLFLGLIILQAAHSQVDLKKVNKSNTWLKIGPNIAFPLGDFSESHSFGLGLDASVQFLQTKASGIGLKAGYISYFGKDQNNNAGIVPLAILYRYYPENKGWFAGLEAGYALISNIPTLEGGTFARPQIGWHTDHWNFFAYFDYIKTEENLSDLQAFGLAATYNLKLK